MVAAAEPQPFIPIASPPTPLARPPVRTPTRLLSARTSPHLHRQPLQARTVQLQVPQLAAVEELQPCQGWQADGHRAHACRAEGVWGQGQVRMWGVGAQRGQNGSRPGEVHPGASCRLKPHLCSNAATGVCHVHILRAK